MNDSFCRIGNIYGYQVFGILYDNKIRTNTIILEDDVFRNYSGFESEDVCLKVDRINLAIV